MFQTAKATTSYNGLFTKKDLLLTTALSLGYLLLSKALVGFKIDQLVLVGIFNFLYYLSFSTRKFISNFSVFIIFWILFDYMKAFPNYMYNTVHIESLYNAEKQVFGINYNNLIVTPNEYFLQHTNAFLDVISGLFYLCWIPVPLIFATYLYFTNRGHFMQFALTFLLVNLLGFIVYYLYPAAAPWYVQQYGFQLQTGTPGNTAGLHRFDQFFNTHIFELLYAKSSNVFAAMPSLHSAYPLIVFYYGLKNKLGFVNILFGTIAAGIWFAAVYTSHHYVLDVLAGIACAAVGIVIFQKVLLTNKKFNQLFFRNL